MRLWNKPIPVELTNEQRAVAILQWIILGGAVGVMLLLAQFERDLLRLVQPAAPLNTRQLRNVYEIIPAATACLAVGYLSMRYRVTVVARRLDFWQPTGGSPAVIHGAILLTVGLGILAFVGLEILPLVQITPAVLLVCGGMLFALLMVGLAARGLHRAFAADD